MVQAFRVSHLPLHLVSHITGARQGFYFEFSLLRISDLNLGGNSSPLFLKSYLRALCSASSRVACLEQRYKYIAALRTRWPWTSLPFIPFHHNLFVPYLTACHSFRNKTYLVIWINLTTLEIPSLDDILILVKANLFTVLVLSFFQ